MRIVDLSDVELKNFEVKKTVSNMESDMFLTSDNGIMSVLKELYPFDVVRYENKIRTLLSIESNSGVIPDYFIKPTFFAIQNSQIRYWASLFRKGITLSEFFNREDIPFAVKKQYLKRIGFILKEMEHIRQSTPLRDFFIGDLHEDNFIVDESGNLLVCDADSIKIDGNKSSIAKYVTPFSLLKYEKSGKYRIDSSQCRISDFVADRNTDLYCYAVIILNFLFGINASDITLEKFNYYLNYMNDVGIDPFLLGILSKIVTSEDNTNPCDYVDTISENSFARTRRLNS